MASPRCATFFLCLIVATFVSTVLSATLERKCVDGQSYNDGCNHCFCANGHTACTLKACFNIDPVTHEMVNLPKIEPPESFWEVQEVKYPEP